MEGCSNADMSQVAYSTEKQIPYNKAGLEVHEKSKVLQREGKRRICNLRKRTVVIILSIALVIVMCAAVGVGVGVSKRNHKPSRSLILRDQNSENIADTLLL